jgi:6-phosphogluconolactonase
LASLVWQGYSKLSDRPWLAQRDDSTNSGTHQLLEEQDMKIWTLALRFIRGEPVALLQLALMTVLSLSSVVTFADDEGSEEGAVFALTNSPLGNAVIVYRRAENGSLSIDGTYSTGGYGSGAGLGSQGAVIVSEDRRFVFAVNAGSDTVSSFRNKNGKLTLIDVAQSGGDLPTSVAIDNKLLYVLNAGSPNNITGFRVKRDGRLVMIPGSTRALSQDSTAPAQVGFSWDGDSVIVTERTTHLIDTFRVNEDGTLQI